MFEAETAKINIIPECFAPSQLTVYIQLSAAEEDLQIEIISLLFLL